MNSSLHVLHHSLADHSIRILRDKDSNSELFRGAILRLTTLLTLEATRDLPLKQVEVHTPLTTTTGGQLDCRVGIVPILRAGLSMVDPLLTMLPEAEVWHLGFYRDEETLKPVTYYHKLPPNAAVDVAFVLDPMLATGGSACAALKNLKSWGVPKLHFLGILASPEGIERVNHEYPDVPIYICAIDEKLNDKGYIVPGLGDAGDRAFNATAV
ncbi:MAG: uracil phosphoribosyltransferase [Kiritimatiellae bacterium]|jgi:uracil phosphoribosyltransferase|nr:uracil phosphoribosyltransferase [Kiritimatiellia bacterium]